MIVARFLHVCPSQESSTEAFFSVIDGKLSKFDVEEFLIDLYFWFEYSTKCKNELRSFCEFCDQSIVVS